MVKDLRKSNSPIIRTLRRIINESRNSLELVESIWYVIKIRNASKFENRRLLAEIIRETHGIEKGLAMENVRLGFGISKFTESSHYIGRYRNNGGSMKEEPLVMYKDALKSYLEFHKEHNFENDVTKRVKEGYQQLLREIGETEGKFGGIKYASRIDYNDEERALISGIFTNRHSIREFEHTPVDPVNLNKAIELAMHCPSACNRQCQRLYVVERKDFEKLDYSLKGTRGFSDSFDKILFVTGSISSYRDYETFQWIVTPSIFAAYLSLALEIFSIGSCFVQRSLLPNKEWKALAKAIGAPEDEQLICCMGIGNLKDKYKVPVSHRLNIGKMVFNPQIK